MKQTHIRGILLTVIGVFTFVMSPILPVYAAPPVENPQSGYIGVEGTIPSEPPKTAATIATPRSGQVFDDLPITVSGLCTTGLLVKLFSNNVFVGSAFCENGSYTMQSDLLSGRNDLVARIHDALDQAGPDSNIVTVTFNDDQFNPFAGDIISLTSNYAQRGADPGKLLTWPVILQGGNGPYAISIDWGDGSPLGLMSTPFTGTLDLSHTYEKAGVYRVIIKGTDKNGIAAYLQLVAVANGAITSKSTSTDPQKEQVVIARVLWTPVLISIPLIMSSFWLGRRYELATLRRHLEAQKAKWKN